jgi:hypothetical protein
VVGHFGNWRSSKSHFMNLMDRHSTELSAAGGLWCKVVQIYFNARH